MMNMLVNSIVEIRNPLTLLIKMYQEIMKLRVSQLRKGDMIKFESDKEKIRLINLLNNSGYSDGLGKNLAITLNGVYKDSLEIHYNKRASWNNKSPLQFIMSEDIEADEPEVKTPETYFYHPFDDAWLIGSVKYTSLSEDDPLEEFVEGLVINNDFTKRTAFEVIGHYDESTREEYISWVQKKQEEKQIKVGDWVKSKKGYLGLVVSIETNGRIGLDLVNSTFMYSYKSDCTKIAEEEAKQLHDQAFEQLKKGRGTDRVGLGKDC